MVHSEFLNQVEKMPGLLSDLLSGIPQVRKQLPRVPLGGVYLFSEAEQHLYVGRTDNIRGRHGRHCLRGATKSQASFAFKLAREKTNNLARAYKPGTGTRKDLMKDEEFRAAFLASKERIASMDFRFVAVADPNTQYLFEFYAAQVLATPYNHFENS